MQNTTNTARAEAEFHYVAAQLTDAEVLAEYEAVTTGRFQGQTYVMEGCGCWYGTIGLKRGICAGKYDGYEVEYLRDHLLDDSEFNQTSGWGTTALEDELYDIAVGDTPATSAASAWLHGLLQGELVRRGVTAE